MEAKQELDAKNFDRLESLSKQEIHIMTEEQEEIIKLIHKDTKKKFTTLYILIGILYASLVYIYTRLS